ncbi:MAG: carboxymuconolactone decarboxylase family protein [Sphingomonadales bacterium]|nr:carboxymuconolactone decarboxylase family protein [Sphingomonadales bacterium]
MASTKDFAERIPPLPYEQFTPEQDRIVGGWHHLNFSKVLVRNPAMYATFVPWLRACVAETTLPPRDRQAVCLRMLRLCGDVYEWTHHVTISQRAGLNEAEIADMTAGEGTSLTPRDRVILRATEELQTSQFVSDATWTALLDGYIREQAMELVMLAGCYLTMAMITKSFGMQLEEDEADHEAVNALRTYT